MARVVHFEIPAADPDDAVAFYQKVFGWQISKWEGPQDYWIIKTGEPEEAGIDGAITRKENLAATTNTVDVASVDESSQKVMEAGGKIVVPKMAVPGVGYMVYCADLDDNVFGMMQADPSAH